MYDVNLFIGTAAAMAGNQHSYPVGEQHALLVFLRLPKGAEPDWLAAESIVTSKGWVDVQLQQASTVDPSTLDIEPNARPSYEQAMADGWALIVFSEPV
jgi:hypothetical protein